MKDHGNSDLGWAERPGPQRVIRIVLYCICAGLVLAELLVHRHVEHSIERLPAFYVLYGFLSLILAVMAARGLRRLVTRDEGYYDHDA